MRFQRAFINYPETMVLEVNFEEPEMKAALLTLVQRTHRTAKLVDKVVKYREPKKNARRAVYRLPSNLL